MAARWKKKAVELVTGLAFTNKKYPAVIPYVPAKTAVSGIETKYFNRTTPERRGISSERIYKMLSALEEEPRANLHNLLIIKDGEVISECSHPGYDVNIRHLAHSMSKTLTGMAIGILVDEKVLDLDRRITDIFPEYEYTDKRFADMTVRHLMTMSSGVPFSEVGSVTESEWTRAFFESRLNFTPGSTFAYNSMNSYILAKTVVRLSGMSLMDFIGERIFRPLGIRNAFWEVGPEGVEKGGWGVYLSAESWAKLGVMMLNFGSFEGRRILSEKWVGESITTQIKVSETAGDFNYGYQLWVHRENGQFLFNGMLGQNVWICPKNNIVVVANCENNELFQKSAVLDIIQRYLGESITGEAYSRGALALLRDKEKHFFEKRHWIRPKPVKKGITYRLGLRRRTPFDSRWSRLLGTYTFAPNNQGILPLFIRAMQNNYSGGIESVTFEREGEHLFFTSHEGDTDYRLEVGIYDFKNTVLNFNGEKYIVRAVGEATEDEDRHPIFKLELIFPEMPNSRKMQFSFGENGRLIFRMTENPNERIAEPLIESIYTTNPKFAFAVKMLERRLGDRFIIRKLQGLFSPTLIGANTKAEEYSDIVANERARAEEADRATEAISRLIQNATALDDE